MKEKIRARMEAHVNSIISKSKISDAEYMLIAGYLSKLEFEEQQETFKKTSEESREQLKNAISLLGGAF